MAVAAPGSKILLRAFLLLPLILVTVVSSPVLDGAPQTSSGRAREYTFEIVHSYPHDASAFTQGLAYRDGFLYESTGLNGQSSLRKVRLETGDPVRKIALPAEFFGEGIAILNHEIIQLTWQSKTGLVYDVDDFHMLRTFRYRGEGWGLTTDGRHLLMSDGTSELRVLDPKSFSELRRLKVRDERNPVSGLNELEFVEGEIFANVWHTDKIARISPESGKVLGWIDLTGILSPLYRRPPEAVLNGIAYDAQGKRLFVTGKLWPTIFQIRLVGKR